MTSPTITQEDLFRAVLALDVYHRGYNAGLLSLDDAQGAQIGNATVERSSAIQSLIGETQPGAHEAIGFYALEYDWNGQTVIAYRGTDDGFASDADSDVVNGFGIGGGAPDGPQAQAAVEFFRSIAGGDPWLADIELVGQSLGGGLAGYVAALYSQDAVRFRSDILKAFSLK